MDIFEKMKKKIGDISRRDDKILDIGTGDGERLRGIVAYCSKLDKMVSWTGIDTSEERLAKARENLTFYNNVVLQPGDGFDIAFGNGYFDVVIGTKSCFYPEEAFRVLKPGGHYLYVGAGDKDWIELRALFSYTSAAYLSRKAVYDKLIKAGFKLLEYEDFLSTEVFANRSELITFFSKGFIVPHNTPQELSEQIKIRKSHLKPHGEIRLRSHEWFALSKKTSPRHSI